MQDKITQTSGVNSNGPMMSTCKWNANKLKNVTNKMCVKTAINVRLKNLLRN